MTRLFRLRAAGAGSSDWRQTITLPPRGIAAGDSSDSGGGGISPYVAQCFSLFPSGDYRTAVLALYGLADGAAVLWSVSDSDEDNFLQSGGNSCADSVCLAAWAGGTLVVSAQVDGISVGTIDVGAYFDGLVTPCPFIFDLPP